MFLLERPDGARIHYEVHGCGAPVLRLGADGSAGATTGAHFDAVIALSRTRAVIAADGRFDGVSDAPAEPFSWATITADHIALLDDLGLDQVDVVASGIGCAHAWRLVHDAPERVRSVVCDSPVGRDGIDLGPYFAPFDEAMRVARADGMAGVVAAARRDGRFDRNPAAGPFAARLHRDESFRDELVALGRERYIALLVRFRDGLWTADSPWFSVSEEWMTGFPVPMLVLPAADCGEEATVSPATAAKRLARDVPAVQLVDATPAEAIAGITAFLAHPTVSAWGA